MIDRQKDKVKVFGELQEKDSINRYGKQLEMFLLFLWKFQPKFNLDERQVAALKANNWDDSTIQELLESIFMKKYPINHNRFEDPVYLYCAYAGMEKVKGQFKEPQCMTGLMAVFKFVIRLIIFKKVNLDPTLAMDLMFQDYDETVFIYVKKNSKYITPYGLVAEMMALFSVASNGLIGKSNLQVDHLNPGEAVSFKGITVTKIGLQMAVEEILKKANDMLAELGWKFNITEMDKMLDQHVWKEPLRNQIRGGSILKSPIVVDLTKKFLSDNKPIFRTQKAINNYMEKAWKFRKMILLLLHLTSGQPARATELESMTITNSNSLKSVYWRGQSIMTCTVYNKINSVTGSDHVICRALPKSATRLLLFDLAIVRTAER